MADTTASWRPWKPSPKVKGIHAGALDALARALPPGERATEAAREAARLRGE